MTPREAYYAKLKSRRWRNRRWEIIRRDNGRCTNCWTTHRLQVHHLQYLPGRDPWDYPDEMLVSLCRNCHELAHSMLPPEMRFDIPPRIG